MAVGLMKKNNYLNLMATTVGMAAANATAAGLPREVLKWV
jgi:hypothetical protein